MLGRIQDSKLLLPQSAQGRTRCWGSCTRPWRLSPTRTLCWLPTACSLTRVSPWRRPLLPPTKPTSTARAGGWTSAGPMRLRIKSTNGSATRPKVGVADRGSPELNKKSLHSVQATRCKDIRMNANLLFFWYSWHSLVFFCMYLFWDLIRCSVLLLTWL